jgi:hypothetical protein
MTSAPGFAESSEEFTQLRKLKAKCTAFEGRRDQLIKELLQNEQDFVQARRNYTDRFNSLAPIHVALPNEILLNVFQRAQDEDKATRTPAYPRIEGIFSQICGRWRSLALSTPSLWDFLHFREDSPIEEIAMYLDRSQDQPIDISIGLLKEAEDMYAVRSYEEAHGVIAKFSEVTLPILLPALGRCRRLFLKSGEDEIFLSVCTYLETNPIYLLQTLHTDNYPFPVPRPSTKLPRMPQTVSSPTRKLRSGTRHFYPISETLVHLRLEKLVTIHDTIMACPVAMLSDIFALPRLETFSVMGPIFVDRGPYKSLPRPWLSGSLKHLRCDGCFEGQFAHHLLFNLLAPSLESLAMPDMMTDAARLANTDKTYRFPALKTLELGPGLKKPTSREDTIAGLSKLLTPALSVEHLVVKDPFTLDLVVTTAAHSGVLPALKELTVLNGDVRIDDFRLALRTWSRISVFRAPEEPVLIGLPQEVCTPDLVLTSVERAIPAIWKPQWDAQGPGKRSFPWPCPQVKHRWEVGEDGSKALKTEVSWPFDVRLCLRLRYTYCALTKQHFRGGTFAANGR